MAMHDTDQLNLIEETPDVVDRLLASIDMFQERIAELEFAEEDRGWVNHYGEQNIEFARHHLLKIIAKSRLFYLINPLIHRGVSLQSDYVFSQGVTIQATNKAVNAVLQDFNDNPKNKREITGHKARLLKEQTLMLDGNVFLVLFTDTSGDGSVQIRSIIVEEITEIVCDPDDGNDVWFYKREWTSIDPSTNKMDRKVGYYPDICYVKSPASKQLSFNGHPVYWDSPIVHVKVGELEKSKYGAPEVYSALDWAQAHKNFLQDWATIVRAYARFAWNVKVVGGRNAVDATKTKLASTVTSTSAIERNPAPTTGSFFVAPKDGTTVDPIRTAGATTNARDGRELRLQVAAALGIPDTMLAGDAATGNLATAQTLDRPTELKFRSRQQLWGDVLAQVYQHVIYWAIIAPAGPLRGKIRTTIDKSGKQVVPNAKGKQSTHVEVVFPALLEHSVTERIEAVTNAVTLNGKQFALQSPSLIKLTIRLMFQALGLNDIDELVEAVFKDISDEELKKQPTDPNAQKQPSDDADKPQPSDNGDGSGYPSGGSDTRINNT